MYLAFPLMEEKFFCSSLPHLGHLTFATSFAGAIENSNGSRFINVELFAQFPLFKDYESVMKNVSS